MLAATVVTAVGVVAEPGATLLVAGAAWLTVAGFSRPPYSQLQVTWQAGARAALVLSLVSLAGTGIGAAVRKLAVTGRRARGGARPVASGGGGSSPGCCSSPSSRC